MLVVGLPCALALHGVLPNEHTTPTRIINCTQGRSSSQVLGPRLQRQGSLVQPRAGAHRSSASLGRI